MALAAKEQVDGRVIAVSSCPLFNTCDKPLCICLQIRVRSRKPIEPQVARMPIQDKGAGMLVLCRIMKSFGNNRLLVSLKSH